MTTIYDIAKAAGVTATTVSNVLSGKGSVSIATRERVLKYVQELEYEPNLIARSLIKGRTGTIGLILPAIDNPFYAEVTAVVERLAYAAHLRIFVTTLTADDQMGQELLKDLTLRRVDGLLVAAGTWSSQTLRSISELRLPVVYCFWGSEEPEATPYVTFDFEHGGRLAAEHLIRLGHTRFGVVTNNIAEEGWGHYLRVLGFKTIVEQYGLTLDPTFILAGYSSPEGGKVAGHKLLTHPTPPTAIFATNDLMAIGVMSAAWELGLHIPHDISIVGLDDIALTRYTTPPLTSVNIDRVTLMTKAIELLLNAIEGQQVTSLPLFPATLAVRGSTGPCSR